MRKDVEIITELFNSEPDVLLGDGETKYSEDDIESYLNNRLNKSFVCEVDEDVVGVLLAQFWKNYVYLHTIVVDAEFREKGVGSILMNAMEKLAKEEKKYVIELFSEIGNKSMQSFVKKRNYEKGGKFVFYSKKIRF